MADGGPEMSHSDMIFGPAIGFKMPANFEICERGGQLESHLV